MAASSAGRDDECGAGADTDGGWDPHSPAGFFEPHGAGYGADDEAGLSDGDGVAGVVGHLVLHQRAMGTVDPHQDGHAREADVVRLDGAQHALDHGALPDPPGQRPRRHLRRQRLGLLNVKKQTVSLSLKGISAESFAPGDGLEYAIELGDLSARGTVPVGIIVK